MLVSLLLFSQYSFAEYETYIQVDKATEKGKYFVLFSLFNTNAELKNQGGLIHAVLAPGETVQESYRSTLYPKIEYKFDISIKRKTNLYVIVNVIILNKGTKVYENKYRTFVTYSNGF